MDKSQFERTLQKTVELFNEFVGEVLPKNLVESEMRKHHETISPVIGWGLNTYKYLKGDIPPNRQTWSTIENFIQLTYAYKILKDNKSLPGASEMSKLLNKDQFFGFWYELVIAAIFVGSFFRILEWCDKKSESKPEFNAIYIPTQEVYSVECKVRESSSDIEKWIKRKFNKSLRKASDYPLLIFEDINLRDEDFTQLVTIHNELELNTTTDQGKFLALRITNILDLYGEGWEKKRLSITGSLDSLKTKFNHHRALHEILISLRRYPSWQHF